MSTEPAPTPVTSETPASAEQISTEAPKDLTPTDTRAQADKLVAEGKKAIALKQWEEGVNKYAEALDLMRQLVGDFDPQMAPLLLSYGKALYELAFSQQGVMGKDEVAKETNGAVQSALDDAAPQSSNFVFSADPASDDEDDEEPTGEAGAGDTSIAQTASGAQEEEGDDADEPEDDYNAAWEVLDVARTIYAKMVEDVKEGDEGREVKLCLAECYVALGDVSCETENFPQAVQDYKAALNLKSALLPLSSRALTSVHYQLATALEFTPKGRTEALTHVEKALEGFKQRKSELETSSSTVGGEASSKFTNEKERNEEIKDVESLIGDLEVKIEELKAAPENGDLVAESIDHLLGGSGNGVAASVVESVSGPVNDLTSMVRKKAPKVAAKNIVKPVEEGVKVVENGAEGFIESAMDVVGNGVGKVKEVVENGLEQVKEGLVEVESNGKRKAEVGGDEPAEKKTKVSE